MISLYPKSLRSDMFSDFRKVGFCIPHIPLTFIDPCVQRSPRLINRQLPNNNLNYDLPLSQNLYTSKPFNLLFYPSLVLTSSSISFPGNPPKRLIRLQSTDLLSPSNKLITNLNMNLCLSAPIK